MNDVIEKASGLNCDKIIIDSYKINYKNISKVNSTNLDIYRIIDAPTNKVEGVQDIKLGIRFNLQATSEGLKVIYPIRQLPVKKYISGEITSILFYFGSEPSNQQIKLADKIAKYLNPSIKSYFYISNEDNIDSTNMSFVNDIDKTENSIISNYSQIKLRKNFPVFIDITQTYTIDFQNPLRPGSFRSAAGFRALNDSTLGASNNEFFIEDDSSGLIRIYKIDSGNKVILKTNSGTINYDTGLVKILNLKPSSVINVDKTIDVIAEPVEYTVSSLRNNILVIVDTDVNINMKVE